MFLYLAVECEHDDDIYGHSYDDHDYGMSPGTGRYLMRYFTVECVTTIFAEHFCADI